MILHLILEPPYFGTNCENNYTHPHPHTLRIPESMVTAPLPASLPLPKNNCKRKKQ